MQDALEIICSLPVSTSSLIPSTTVVTSSLFGGADRITFFAPAVMCP